LTSHNYRRQLSFQSFSKTFKRELTINILDSKDAADAPDLSPLEHPWTGRIAQISGQQFQSSIKIVMLACASKIYCCNLFGHKRGVHRLQ
jgi:hypothetical protein